MKEPEVWQFNFVLNLTTYSNRQNSAELKKQHISPKHSGYIGQLTVATLRIIRHFIAYITRDALLLNLVCPQQIDVHDQVLN